LRCFGHPGLAVAQKSMRRAHAFDGFIGHLFEEDLTYKISSALAASWFEAKKIHGLFEAPLSISI